MSDGIGNQGEKNRHLAGSDLIGFKVEATDGPVGQVDEHSDEVGDACLVVDTGNWIFGRQVLLPTDTIDRVDRAEKKIHVARTKDEIKKAPELDVPEDRRDAEFHEHGTYYGRSPI